MNDYKDILDGPVPAGIRALTDFQLVGFLEEDHILARSTRSACEQELSRRKLSVEYIHDLQLKYNKPEGNKFTLSWTMWIILILLMWPTLFISTVSVFFIGQSLRKGGRPLNDYWQFLSRWLVFAFLLFLLGIYLDQYFW